MANQLALTCDYYIFQHFTKYLHFINVSIQWRSLTQQDEFMVFIKHKYLVNIYVQYGIIF